MSEAASIVLPPPAWRVLAAGVATTVRRPAPEPVLPTATLGLPEQVVEAPQVADYARACGFDPALGVPPTFPHILAFPLHMALMMRRDFPFPMAGLVHVANRIEQVAPLVVGDRLDIRACCRALLTHPRGQAFTIAVAIHRAGRPVWLSTSTYLYRRARPGIGHTIPILFEPTDPLHECWRDTVPLSIGRDYARLSGDRNPIHTSRLGARLFGFSRPIAHGMWSLARAVAALTPCPGNGPSRIDAAFRAPLPLGAAVAVRADTFGRFQLVGAHDNRIHLTGALSC